MGFMRCSWSQVSAFSCMISHWHRMSVAVQWPCLVPGFMGPGSLPMLEQVTRYGNSYVICISPCTGSMLNANHGWFYLIRWCMVSNSGPLNLKDTARHRQRCSANICIIYIYIYMCVCIYVYICICIYIYRLCVPRYVMDIFLRCFAIRLPSYLCNVSF